MQDQATVETPPPKRRFWQIHLSTMIRVTVLAAIFLFLNIRTMPVTPPISLSDVTSIACEDCGWPFVWSRKLTPLQRNQLERIGKTFDDPLLAANAAAKFDRTFYDALAADAGICLTGLLLFAVFLEWLIRRRPVKP
jgi:hypothetical protein